jgi:hypothetical protein
MSRSDPKGHPVLRRMLVFADDECEISWLEGLLHEKQADVITYYIEQSGWYDDLCELRGVKGTLAERRKLLRAVILASYQIPGRA